MTQWTNNFFNNMYLDMFMTRSQEDLHNESNIIRFFTHAKEKQSIADFCCGTGSVTNILNNDTLEACGVEYAQNYVDIAKQLYPDTPVFQGDALTFQFNKKFDIVYNWFSSFGYFSNEENYLLLSNMYSHLKNNGTILIEIYNSQHIVDNFNEHFIYLKNYQGEEYKIIRQSQIDNTTLEQKWIFENLTQNKNCHTYHTKTKLYLAQDIINMLESVGFKNCHCYERPAKNQELTFTPMTENSSRIIITGQK